MSGRRKRVNASSQLAAAAVRNEPHGRIHFNTRRSSDIVVKDAEVVPRGKPDLHWPVWRISHSFAVLVSKKKRLTQSPVDKRMGSFLSFPQLYRKISSQVKIRNCNPFGCLHCMYSTPPAGMIVFNGCSDTFPPPLPTLHIPLPTGAHRHRTEALILVSRFRRQNSCRHRDTPHLAPGPGLQDGG